MEFDTVDFIATFLAYAVPLGLWFLLTRKPSLLWTPAGDFELERPKLDMLLALAAVVGIIALNLAYHRDWLLPQPAGVAGSVVFVLNLLIIWSPIAIVLAARRQGPTTCLLSPNGLIKKVAWGFATAVIGMAVCLVVSGRFADLPLSILLLAKFDPVKVLQSLVQFFGVGFLLVRIVGVAGRTVGILVCSALYGLVKYPYYMSSYGMSFAEASTVIAFSIGVAFVVISLIYQRKDVLVVAILHVFIDMVQNT